MISQFQEIGRLTDDYSHNDVMYFKSILNLFAYMRVRSTRYSLSIHYTYKNNTIFIISVFYNRWYMK